jgi:isohexenylglutaconyl-CoA hydratase
LPEAKTLLLALDAGVLHVTLNRPERRNAMSSQLVDELCATFDATRTLPELRAIVLRGAGGNFCAGADVKNMSSTREGASAAPMGDPKQLAARANRRFGDVMTAAQATDAPIVALVEGAVMGGGFGLVCVSDLAIALSDARFGLPETGLGLIPAQIAPFVVQRIGLTQARRLMLTGARFDGIEALRIGLVHELASSTQELEAKLAAALTQIRRCGPRANAATKRLVLGSLGRPLPELLDEAAQVFAEASLGDEAREGTTAFVQKRPPSWAK